VDAFVSPFATGIAISFERAPLAREPPLPLMAPAIQAMLNNRQLPHEIQNRVLVKRAELGIPSPPESGLMHRDLRHQPLNVVKAQGNWICLSDGRQILDATGGAAVSCLGHGNERVKAAIARQLDQISYCHTMFFSVPAAEELGTELINSTRGKMARAFIVSSGRCAPVFFWRLLSGRDRWERLN
jgi:4-aminobutyrate aminotransferase-like enzyme